MTNEILHFLLRAALAAVNIVLTYLIQPLPQWQQQLVRAAAVVSSSAALVMLDQGAGRGSIAPFLLLLLVSRPLPARGRWKFALATSCLFFLVGSIPYQWMQMHGLL